MASPAKRLESNVSGPFYVDSTCIDCATCRWMAPAVFNEKGGKSRVFAQPQAQVDKTQALQALISCPTGSIGLVDKTAYRDNLRAAIGSFPRLIADNVYHCGYHSEKSFGAASYLLVREQGNVLIDSPRFAKPLVENIENLGGVRTLFLTHQDDVADHEQFAKHFGCTRVVHEAEARGGLSGVERVIKGYSPEALDSEVLFIPVPGHTRGSTCLLYKNEFLFSGDHVAWSPHLKQIYAFRDACWYDWNTLRASMKSLAQYAFAWILPGHGWPCHFTQEEMKAQMQRCLRWLEKPGETSW